MRPARRRSTLALAAVLLSTAACAGSSSTATPTRPTSPSPSPSASATAATPEPASPTPDERVPPLRFNAPVAVPVAGSPPVPGRPWYLAVGDSITFGFTVDPARAGVNSSWALLLQGMLAARGEAWTLYDTACPGETSVSYSTQCGGRAAVPFLAARSQEDADLAAIRTAPADLRLILVDLGSNDLLRALRRGTPVPEVIAALRATLTRILAELHGAAPRAQLVLANFYNPLQDAIPDTEPELAAVNAMIAEVAAAGAAALADFHAAINGATTPNSALGTWVDLAHRDVHPTVAGQGLLARTALAVIR